ncbi:hypothetical protein EV426DRAFT_703224 [Tirmania nivea]|nr:hypothetical protein EV426DRAFT_703224 [Tirmania nivea]
MKERGGEGKVYGGDMKSFNHLRRLKTAIILKDYPDLAAWIDAFLQPRSFTMEVDGLVQGAIMTQETPHGSPLSSSLFTVSMSAMPRNAEAAVAAAAAGPVGKDGDEESIAVVMDTAPLGVFGHPPSRIQAWARGGSGIEAGKLEPRVPEGRNEEQRIQNACCVPRGVAQNAAHLLECPGLADGKGRRREQI